MQMQASCWPNQIGKPCGHYYIGKIKVRFPLIQICSLLNFVSRDESIWILSFLFF